MKILKPSFSVIVLFVLAVGCRKNDFQNELEQEAVAAVPVAAAVQAFATQSDSTGWNSSADWKLADQEDFSVYYININDRTITDEVVDNGLVLVYKKNETSVTALPSEEGTKNQSQYWYHQVTEGNILISVDSYGATAPDASSSFKYFVLTPEKIDELEAKGYSAEKLMELTFEEASLLF